MSSDFATSEIVQILNKGHHNVRMDAEAWQRREEQESAAARLAERLRNAAPAARRWSAGTTGS